MKQTQAELDAAMAEFLAKQAPTVCSPIRDAKTAAIAAKLARDKRKEAEARLDVAERAERNAENRRYDDEGVYYIGGEL